MSPTDVVRDVVDLKAQVNPLYAISSTFFSLQPYNLCEDFLYAVCGQKNIVIFARRNAKLAKLIDFELPVANEDLYTCCWLQLAPNMLCIAAAGKGQAVHVVDVLGRKILHEHVGHGKAIFHLVTHPKQHDLLFSCSEDLSIKLWRITKDCCECLFIFAGEHGHRGPVLALDVDKEGALCCSSGMDYCVKVWKIPPITTQRQEPNFVVQTAENSSNRILKEYIDCIKWFGPLIICKGIHGRLRILRFINSNAIDAICDLYYPVPSPLWYFRFSIDPISKMLAVGGPQGKIFLFNLAAAAGTFSLQPEREIKLSKASAKDQAANVRDLIFLGENLVSISEEGKVFLVNVGK